MTRSGIGRVRQQAARAALPVVTRQANATVPIVGRGSRSAESRGTPTRRGDDKDAADDRESVSGREDDDQDDDEPEPVAP